MISHLRLQSNNEDIQNVMKQFINQPGIGTACMDDLEDISMYIQCKESQQNNFTDNYAVSFRKYRNTIHCTIQRYSLEAAPSVCKLITSYSR